MTTLQGTALSATYKDLLQVPAGIDGTLRDVEDGEGTVSALKVSTAGGKVTGTFTMTGVYTGTFDVLVIDEESSDPANPAEGVGQVWQSDGTGTGGDGDLIFERQAASSTWYCNMTDQSRRGTMWHDESVVTVGNAIAHTLTASQIYGTYSNQSAAADADVFTNGVYLRKGTYTFYVLGITDTDRGKIDWTIDGVVLVSGEDWYAGSTTYNVVKSTASVAVTFDGWHQVKGTVNGKNASSSGYVVALTKFWFEPAAD